MPYVSLDGQGNVTGIFANPQAFSRVFLADNDAAVLAFLAAQAPQPTCYLWQLQAVLSPSQWAAVQAAVAAANNAALTAFAAHGNNLIPANSTTLISLGAAIGLTADQVKAIVIQASAVAIP